MKKTRAFIYVILAGILWGTSGIFVHYLAPYGFTSIQMTAIRGVVSMTVMLIFTLITDRGRFAVRGVDLLYFAGIGILLFSTATLYYTAMQMTSVSTAVVLMYTAPIYVAVFSALALGEKFTKGKLVAIALMLCGCALVSGIIGGLKFDGVGLILGALTGVSYAAYNILTKLALRSGAHPVSTTTYSFIFLSVIAVCVSNPVGIFECMMKEPAATVPLMIGLGILTFVAPYFLYTLGMRDLPAATTTSLGIVEPMAATLFSVTLLGEKLDVAAVIGTVLILVALIPLSASDD